MYSANCTMHERSYFSNPPTLLMRNSRIFSSSVFPLRSPIPRNVRLDQFAPYQNPASADETLSPKSSWICVSMFFAPSSLNADTIFGMLYGSHASANGTAKPSVSHILTVQSGSIAMISLTSGYTKPGISARVTSSRCARVRSP
uniref:Uncharacterized protein n=1 Tax=Candidatus Methanogaster sp. ANME-2c ERB4 TaxID=2759911 RepID=A0A7G9YQR9_9EURY|nr:hypothetical protein MGFAJANB_00001 [Methanosarcinales archaeon ANME-2c ERB4]QNO50353.1 hypothetical protein DDJHKDJF_00001 [Methanosarcinales archaeon ANME-2c ERB4]